MSSVLVGSSRSADVKDRSVGPAPSSGARSLDVLGGLLDRGVQRGSMDWGRSIVGSRALLTAAMLAALVFAGANPASAHPVDDQLAQAVGQAGGFSQEAISDAGEIEKNVDRWMHGDLPFPYIVSDEVARNGATIPGRASEVMRLLTAMAASAPELTGAERAAIVALYFACVTR